VAEGDRASGGSESSYSDVIDRVLDKGIVVEAWMHLRVNGIDLITADARVIVASIETYMRSWPALDGAAAMATRSRIADRARDQDGSKPSQRVLGGSALPLKFLGNLHDDLRPEVVNLDAEVADRHHRENSDQRDQQTVFHEVLPPVVAQKGVYPREEVTHSLSEMANDVPGENTQILAGRLNPRRRNRGHDLRKRL
jgi:hypothetical protein